MIFLSGSKSEFAAANRTSHVYRNESIKVWGKNISDYLIPGREGLIKPTCEDRMHTVEDEVRL